MDTIKFKKNRTKIIAHRGVSGLETENTNAAFIAAGNRSYAGIETDLHRTKDGYFVTIHDNNTERVSGEKLAVEETALSDLKNIVLTDKDGTKNRSDLRVPTLEEYLCICKKYDKISVLELKADFSEDELKQIVSIAEGYRFLDHVIFISFYLNPLKKLRAQWPDQPIQYLTDKFTDRLIPLLLENKFDLDIHYSALTEENLAELHSHAIKVNCWTVDSPADGERLASWGIDYITSNILE